MDSDDSRDEEESEEERPVSKKAPPAKKAVFAKTPKPLPENSESEEEETAEEDEYDEEAEDESENESEESEEQPKKAAPASKPGPPAAKKIFQKEDVAKKPPKSKTGKLGAVAEAPKKKDSKEVAKKSPKQAQSFISKKKPEPLTTSPKKTSRAPADKKGLFPFAPANSTLTFGSSPGDRNASFAEPEIARENEIRGLFANHPNDPLLQNPYLELIDVYSAPNTFRVAPFSQPKLPRMFLSNDTRTGSSIVDQAKFQANWASAGGALLNGLDWESVFVAGGAVLACLTSEDIATYSGTTPS